MALKKAKQEKKTENSEELEALKSQLARALADYDNLRKRTEAEKEIWFRVAGSRIIEKFLGVYDMLASAQGHLNDAGLAMVLGEFKKAIEDEGYEEVKIELGVTEFNSHEMEAIEVIPVEEENKKNKIAEVLLTGWKSKTEEVILRPAKVKVFN